MPVFTLLLHAINLAKHRFRQQWLLKVCYNILFTLSTQLNANHFSCIFVHLQHVRASIHRRCTGASMRRRKNWKTRNSSNRIMKSKRFPNRNHILSFRWPIQNRLMRAKIFISSAGMQPLFALTSIQCFMIYCRG